MTAEHQAVVIGLKNITKRFPGVLANDAICLDFHRGEVHALLGENGAGKSTLIGILAGMQQPDQGRIEVAGRAVRISSPQAALKLGIGTVYQHSHLIPSLSVMENLMLGSAWWRPRNPRATLARFRELSTLLSVQLDPDAQVGRLSLGQQQQVEIMRALWHGQRALILDEPTSMLTPQGVTELAAVVRRLRDHGVAVIFITHKLGEAYELADRISVLRRGRVVGELAPEQLQDQSRQAVIDAVVGMMFARDDAAEDKALLSSEALGEAAASPALTAGRPAPDSSGAPRLHLSNAHTSAEPGECPLRGVELQLWPGEIVGIAGVDGNDQKHLAEVLAGQPVRVIGNLPYHITSSIIGRVLDEIRACQADSGAHARITSFDIMIQKEVGDRICSTHGTKVYGVLSVLAYMLCDVRILLDVPPNAFYPRPKVTSSILRFRPLPAPRYQITDWELFRKVVRAAFNQRRKMLRNSLLPLADLLPEGFLSQPGLDWLERRPEQLSPLEFTQLANLVVEARG